MSDIPDQSTLTTLGEKDKRKRRLPKWGIAVILFVALAAVIVLMVTIAMNMGADAMAPKSGHFQDETLPELSAEGIKCSIQDAYYTNNGSLRLKLKLSNGQDKAQHPEKIEIDLRNENETPLIKVSNTESIDPKFTIPAGGYADLILYIPSQDVLIKDDDLNGLVSNIKAAGNPVDTTDTASSTVS